MFQSLTGISMGIGILFEIVKNSIEMPINDSNLKFFNSMHLSNSPSPANSPSANSPSEEGSKNSLPESPV